MPSFDIVSKLNKQEVSNAVDQANREVSTRFDFKDSGANYALAAEKINITAPTKFQVEQMLVILEGKLAKRGIDARTIKHGEIRESLHESKQELTLQQGISQELAKKIVKNIKDANFKVQAAIQGDTVRVTGKKRDDLQAVIAHLRQQDLELPLQYENFRE
jgi:cyclic-di-GMP-binding protein